MNRAEECFICLKHRGGSGAAGGAVFENALIFIGHAAISKDGTLPYLGHYLVEPKRHTAEMGDLSDAEAQAVGLQLTRTARVLQQVLENRNNWTKTLKASPIDAFYNTHRQIRLDEILPWDFIDHGIQKQFLKNEYNKALKSQPSEPCPMKNCRVCGVC